MVLSVTSEDDAKLETLSEDVRGRREPKPERELDEVGERGTGFSRGITITGR